MNKEIIIIMTGTHSKVVCELAQSLNKTVIGFVTYEESQIKMHFNLPILGCVNQLNEIAEKYEKAKFVIASGSSVIRKKIATTYKLNYATLISKRAYISPSATILKGTVVLAFASVNTNARIGKHSIINTSAIVEHDNYIGDYCHLSPGVALGGTVVLGNQVTLGLNASVKNNTKVTNLVTIGMNSAVTQDITKSGVYAGSPAIYKKELIL